MHMPAAEPASAGSDDTAGSYFQTQKALMPVLLYCYHQHVFRDD